MGLLCDFCGKERSTVHCRSDAACLCLLCDRRVHSANDLSKRHWRTLLCDKCNSQPAVTWRLNDKISLCEICDFNDLHGQINSQDQLKINGYSGCPSTSVFSTIWSFAPDFDGLKSCHRGTITANNDDENEYNRSTTVDLLTDLEKVNAWIGSSTLECSPNKPLASDDSPAQNLQVNFNHAIQISNHHGSAYIYIYILIYVYIFQRRNTGGMSEFEICQDDEPFQNFGIENDWNFSNYDQMFGLPSTNIQYSEKLHEIITKTVFTESTASANSGGDYQEHQVPSLIDFKAHESPWYSSLPENSTSHSRRGSAIVRYKEKKKARK